MTKPLDWVFRTSETGGRRLNESHEVSAEDRQELARMLDILSVDALKVSYTLEPLKKDRFRLSGTIDAKVTQACVVTLDPVPSTISERFSVELYPASEAADTEDEPEEQEVLSTPDIEPYRGRPHRRRSHRLRASVGRARPLSAQGRRRVRLG